MGKTWNILRSITFPDEERQIPEVRRLDCACSTKITVQSKLREIDSQYSGGAFPISGRSESGCQTRKGIGGVEDQTYIQRFLYK